MREVDIPGPGGGGNSLEQLLGDLLQLMGGATPGGGRLELARTLAQGAASNGQPEGNVDPSERIQFEELARVAEMHVAELTGLPVTPNGRAGGGRRRRSRGVGLADRRGLALPLRRGRPTTGPARRAARRAGARAPATRPAQRPTGPRKDSG